MENLQTLFEGMTRPEIRNVEAYDAGDPPRGAVRVMANENNAGVSQVALAAMKEALEEGNRYPEGSCRALREKLAARYGLKPEQILVGNGLDGVFTIFSRTFLCPGDEVVCGELTFSIYADNAEIMGAVPIKVPMTDGYAFDVDGFIKAFTPRTKMIFFCNPNNPTGTMASRADVERMLDAAPKSALFVLDEAYMDFADESEEYSFALLAKYPNLIVARTFSKIYGLAGLRVGWVAAHERLVDYMKRVREPFCVTEIASKGAAAAMDDAAYYEASRKIFLEERIKFSRFLDENGTKYVPSQGNFLLLPLGEKTNAVFAALAENGILAKKLSYKGKELLRMSLGTPEENEKIKAVLRTAGR